MDELIADLLTEVAVAGCMFGLAAVFPFRRMNEDPEFRWNALAALFAFLFALLAGGGLSWLLETLDSYLDQWHALVDSWPLAAIIVAYVVFADFSSYWAHHLLHTRLFWHLHAFHHSSLRLYVLSGLRSSFLHVALLFAGPLLALILFPVYKTPLAFALVSFSQVANQHYTHSNIRVPWSRYIESVFVTPRFHFVHHSVNRQLSNSNFGFLLTLWDRFFGTFTDPELVANDEPLGLDYQNSNWRMLIGAAPPRSAAAGQSVNTE